MYVVRQEGSNGWVSGQWRRVWRGWAADVIGEREVSGGGRSVVEGLRMGGENFLDDGGRMLATSITLNSR